MSPSMYSCFHEVVESYHMMYDSISYCKREQTIAHIWSYISFAFSSWIYKMLLKNLRENAAHAVPSQTYNATSLRMLSQEVIDAFDNPIVKAATVFRYHRWLVPHCENDSHKLASSRVQLGRYFKCVNVCMLILSPFAALCMPTPANNWCKQLSA